MGEKGAKRVVVVGGSGFLGSRAVAALGKVSGIDAVVASRRSDLRVDLSDPSTFEALRGASLVIDLADATSTPPDALAKWCLANGVVLVETTSDFNAIDRLKDLPASNATGTLVLGAGIFTGLSNLIARDAADRVAPAESVSLAVRSSPYSGAGTGTVALMAAMLATQGASFREGKRVAHAPVERGPRVSFATATVPSLRIPLAEVVMLRASTGAATVDGYFSPKPSLLVWAFLAMPAFLLQSSLFAAFMRLYFGFLRRFVLKGVASTVELHTRASNEGKGSATVDLVAPDGMTVGGIAIAAMAAEIVEGEPLSPGIRMIDDVVSLDPVLARMQRLGGERVSLARATSA